MSEDSHPQPGNVLSLDLASRRYADIGFACLIHDSNQPTFPKAKDLGLKGKPLVFDMAYHLDRFCRYHGIRVILIDGPQGWKSPQTGIANMRLCERVLNTPAKTGVIGEVKPTTFLRYIAFSINLFHLLRVTYGWNLLTSEWHKFPKRYWLAESFPTAAWQMFGLEKLPSKSKTSAQQLAQWRKDLSRMTGLKLPTKINHDELQAAVVLPAGRAIAERDRDRIVMVGMDPRFTREDDVLEGWIVCPCLPDQ